MNNIYKGQIKEMNLNPKVKDITTYYILGSHDETHYKNGGATVNDAIANNI